MLSDDLLICKDRFDGIPSEMWFATKHWLDPNVCALLINPTVQAKDLYSQMTTRRFKYTRNGRMHVESKDEYKGRNGGKSPDEMDAVVMMVQLVRMRSGVTPGVIEQYNRNEKRDAFGAPVVTPTTDRADVEDPLEMESEPLEVGQEVHGSLDLAGGDEE